MLNDEEDTVLLISMLHGEIESADAANTTLTLRLAAANQKLVQLQEMLQQLREEKQQRVALDAARARMRDEELAHEQQQQINDLRDARAEEIRAALANQMRAAQAASMTAAATSTAEAGPSRRAGIRSSTFEIFLVVR